MDTIECCICLEELNVCKLHCKHFLCLHCMINIKKNLCPLCQSDFVKYLPRKIQEIVSSNNIETKREKNILDTNDHYDFPPLGS